MKSENFVARMKQPEAGIDVVLDEAAAAQIEKNRLVLAGIIKIILLCGRQGLALRGTDDDGVLGENNRSNFNALLKFSIDSGNDTLKQHLQTCASNATYISKTTQNNLIQIIGDEIQSQVLAEVRDAKFFSILADEVTDKANWEQLSLVLRYVHKGEIKEEFMTFIQCEDITGETLANNILNALREWGLDIQNLRGQGYDGASNMSGKFKGVQARLKEVNPKALYVHCASHCLNLCVLKACSVPQVKNMFELVKEVSNFFAASPKRQRKLESVIAAAFPDSRKQKLVDLCRTRWVERHAALETFADLYTVVCDCFGQMGEEGSDKWDSDSLTRASGMLNSLQNSSFIVAFVTARKGLQYIKPLTVKLQTVARDIALAYQEIAEVTTCIQHLRSNVEATFFQWFGEAERIATAAGFDVSMPRQCQRQTLRDNHPANNSESYFRASIAIPFLDHLLSELNSRFQHSKLAADVLSLVPETLLQNTVAGFNAIPEGLESLATLWDTDLPDHGSLEAEYNRWISKWRSVQDEAAAEGKEAHLPATAAAALGKCDEQLYPNISTILRQLCTLPVTTSEVERSISRLKTIKTYLRSSTAEDRLNGLALMRIHYDRDVNVSNVVDRFAAMFRTRMMLQAARMLNQ